MSSAFADNTPTCPGGANCIVQPALVITKNVLISVPGKLPFFPYTKVNSIQDALNAIQDDKIAGDATVTIQLTQDVPATPDGSASDTIYIRNSDANKIHIVGNCNGKACSITFKPNSNGFDVDDGNNLGLLDNFNIIGQSSKDSIGIYAAQNSSVICGKNITVTKFDTGIEAIYDSYIAAPNAKSEYNLNEGISASRGSVIYAPQVITDHNGGKGIYAWSVSAIQAPGAVSTYNLDGVFSDGNSEINVSDVGSPSGVGGISANNTRWGARASQGAELSMDNGQVLNNGYHGLEAIVNAAVFAPGVTLSGNHPDTYTAYDGLIIPK